MSKPKGCCAGCFWGDTCGSDGKQCSHYYPADQDSNGFEQALESLAINNGRRAFYKEWEDYTDDRNGDE